MAHRSTSRTGAVGSRWSSAMAGRRNYSRRNHHAKGVLAGVAIMTSLNPVGGREPLFLDDLHVGQRFTSGRHEIDEEQVKAFAKQFDPQPFHLDAEAATATLFQGLAASGW